MKSSPRQQLIPGCQLSRQKSVPAVFSLCVHTSSCPSDPCTIVEPRIPGINEFEFYVVRKSRFTDFEVPKCDRVGRVVGSFQQS